MPTREDDPGLWERSAAQTLAQQSDLAEVVEVVLEQAVDIGIAALCAEAVLSFLGRSS